MSVHQIPQWNFFVRPNFRHPNFEEMISYIGLTADSAMSARPMFDAVFSGNRGDDEARKLAIDFAERLPTEALGNFVTYALGCTALGSVAPSVWSAILSIGWRRLHRLQRVFSEDTISNMFDLADPAFLMTADERRVLAQLPDEIEVYRGWAGFNEDEARRGMAWTLDRTTALWFAQIDSWDASGKGEPRRRILTGTAQKSDVLMYLAGHGENEIVVRPGQVAITALLTCCPGKDGSPSPIA